MKRNESSRTEGFKLDGLGTVEQMLPPAARKAPVAAAVLALSIAVALFGMGGGKLAAKASEVGQTFVSGTQDKFGNPTYGIADDLLMRQDAAANLAKIGEMVLGSSDPDVQAVWKVLEAFEQKSIGPAAAFDRDEDLTQAVETLYAKLMPAAGDRAQSAEAQHKAFCSYADIIARNPYNELAQEHNKMASGFPANLAGVLWGGGKVELFE